MLPIPGSPAFFWQQFKARCKSRFEGADPRVCFAFWLFGLINNVLYVIIITAALDLVGPSVPKGVVLVANVLPSLVTKLIVPYYVQHVPYSSRVVFIACGNVLSMLAVAVIPDRRDAATIVAKMAAVSIASVMSGLGEMSFMALTHYYGSLSLASWGSGTGAAGLTGAGTYVLFTGSFGFTAQTTLLLSAFWPLAMLLTFHAVLPQEPLKHFGKPIASTALDQDDHDAADVQCDERDSSPDEGGHLLTSSMVSTSGRSFASVNSSAGHSTPQSRLRRVRPLVVPYMIPLLLVYVSEYTINQGVAPTLIFPLSQTPFSEIREFYPTYNAIYQTGVFLSRTSIAFFRIRHLYTPSLLQLLNLVVLTLHALYFFLPSVWFVFAIILWEGLLGGLVYVSTFAEISDRVPKDEREFSLSITTASDSAGICIAGFVGMLVEVWLCEWNAKRGRPWCKTE